MKYYLYLLCLALLVTSRLIKADEEKEKEDDTVVTTEEEGKEEEKKEGKEEEKKEGNEETKEDKLPKDLKLEDLSLWQSMDLDKDGKLTVAEYEQFSSSPNAQAFVQQMKENKAIEEWAKQIGIDTEKAKAAMLVGVNAARQQNYATQQYYSRLQAQRQREAIAKRNQQILEARQQQQNYWSRLGQMYYQATQRRGGRTEL